VPDRAEVLQGGVSLPVFEALRQIAREQPVRVRVQGDCMSPEMNDGEVVNVLRRGMVLPGDIVAFLAHDGRLTVHRILGYRASRPFRLVTQGDLSPRCDAPVSLERLLGRVPQRRRPLAALRAAARFLRYTGERLKMALQVAFA
jgi:hypothetical protein